MEQQDYKPDNSPVMRFNNLCLELRRLPEGENVAREEKNKLYNEIQVLIPELEPQYQDSMKAKLEEYFADSLKEPASPAELDKKYSTTPHDAHVDTRLQHQIDESTKRDGATAEAHLDRWNNDIEFRIRERYTELAKIAESTVGGLIDSLNLKPEILATRTVLSHADTLLDNMADDLSPKGLGDRNVVLASETQKYVDSLKRRFKDAGYNPQIIDILNSPNTGEEKAKRLSSIKYAV